MQKQLVCFLVFITLSTGLYSQKFWGNFKFWEEDSISKKDGIFLFPLLYYTPDTRLAAGAVGVYYFHTGDTLTSLGRETRLSYVKMLADYTQNKQFDAWSSWNVFSNEERYLFKGEFRFRNFPDRYYGVGNRTEKEQVERYSYDLFHVKLLGLKQVVPNLFVGLDYQFSYEYNFRLDPHGQLAQGNVVGHRGGTGSGVGGVLTYDTRDNVVNAYSGMLFEASSYVFNPVFGSDFNYTSINLTFNKYWEFKKDHVLALNSSVLMNYGGVPFLDMAKAGGGDLLRGYAENRFRDHHFIGAQLEYRFPVWWRFGMVVFTGVGDVFQQPKDLAFNSLKFSVGAGIRFNINKKERLNVRFDYGFGRNSDAFYIMLTEAF